MNLSMRTDRITETWSLDREDSGAKTKNIATITFIDGKFSRCDFHASNPYTREQWTIMAYIEKCISRIEKEKQK